jgi:Aluminium activated malate transporter
MAGNLSFDERKQTWLSRIEKFVGNISTFFVSILKSWYRVGREDPRRVVHAVKVGLALTLVSFLYIFEPLFKGVGENAMWAVMTVVVVFEFTAGKFHFSLCSLFLFFNKKEPYLRKFLSLQ